MATNIYNFSSLYLEYDGYNTGGSTSTVAVLMPFAYPPIGAVGAEYENVVWDTVAGAYVRWRTYAIDNSGQFYPGPGVYGVNTSDFAVETIHYSRNQ